jgi:hypothetical protein
MGIRFIHLGCSFYLMKKNKETRERQILLVDGVKRGDIILDVLGVGTLVLEDVLVVPSEVSGQAMRIFYAPGSTASRSIRWRR